MAPTKGPGKGKRASKDETRAEEYEGKLDKAGKREGLGRCKFSDGSHYEGVWKAGKMEGHGVYRMADGDAYEGMWRANKKDGPGTYHYASGRADVTAYEADAEVGDGVRWSAERDMAWKLHAGELQEQITLDEAKSIADALGVAVPGVAPPRQSDASASAAAAAAAADAAAAAAAAMAPAAAPAYEAEEAALFKEAPTASPTPALASIDATALSPEQ